MTFQEILQKLETGGLKLLAGILVLVVGLVLVHFLTKLIFRRDPLRKVDPTARGFLSALIRIILYSAVVLAAIGVMGVPLSSFVALLASAGVYAAGNETIAGLQETLDALKNKDYARAEQLLDSLLALDQEESNGL